MQRETAEESPSLEALEDQLGAVIARVSEPLMTTVTALIRRINAHVEACTNKGVYLGGHTVLQVLDESADVIARAVAVFEVVMETVADKIVDAMDRKIDSWLSVLETQKNKLPGITPSNNKLTRFFGWIH